jgi:hypothetical protein
LISTSACSYSAPILLPLHSNPHPLRHHSAERELTCQGFFLSCAKREDIDGDVKGRRERDEGMNKNGGGKCAHYHRAPSPPKTILT